MAVSTHVRPDAHGPHHKELFHRLANTVSHVIGTPAAFAIAALAVIIWSASGPVFHFSDTWQLVINTSTTIITFLVVFLIQHTQNHDAKAIHLKLDELLRAVQEARTGFVDLEDLPEQELVRLEGEFRRLRREYEAPSGEAPQAPGSTEGKR
jgi:low affinity Fe/Cu permease